MFWTIPKCNILIYILNLIISFIENEEDGKGDGEFTSTIDRELIDSIINQTLKFDNLDLEEEDVNDLDDNVATLLKICAKHVDSDDSIN